MGAPRITDLSGMSRNAGAAGSSTDAQTRALTARGEVVIAPLTEADEMVVALTDVTRQYGITIAAGNWEPRGSSLPEPGASCLVVFDSQGDAFVPIWSGTSQVSSVHALGDLIPSAASTRPGCLLCDGTAYTLTAHPELEPLALACPAYVSGGILTVPDGSGRVPMGAGTGAGLTARTLGQKLGEESHLLTSGESGLPAHGHGLSDPGHSHSANSGTNAYSSGAAGGYFFTNNPPTHPGYGGLINSSFTGIGVQANAAANAASSHNNIQPSFVVNWFIYAGT